MHWDMGLSPAPTLAQRDPISVLIFEDNPADAKLMLRALLKGGLSVRSERARNEAEFQQLMRSKHIDVILADYYVPGWNGRDLIRWSKREGYTTPIILVTGSLGDEEAVLCMKEGASDYVLKDKLEHLPIAVRHAIEERYLRAARDLALDQLRESAEQYKLVFNSNPHPMWVYDLESLQFLAVNDAAIQDYGYSREEFLRMTLKDIRPPEEVPALLARLAGPYPELHPTCVWRHLKKDGNILSVKVTEGRFSFMGRKAGLICVEDVTERQLLERQFLQAQKMEAVGRLAAGVAHDFNNLLMVISSSAQMIQDVPDDRGRTDRYATQIRDAADKAASLTRQLLAFSRQQVLDVAVIDVNVVITDLEKMLLRVLGEDIQIMVRLESKLSRIKADRGQIEQVLMNLAVNARDAMPKGGKLVIETKNIELDQEYLTAHGVLGQAGHYVLLCVSDTGVGMTPEVQARIFEPFFTTKELGKGTGLGLATVYGIVKQSGGWIWVYSETGGGTSFKIYLPSTREKIAPGRAMEISSPVSGTETILLAEDEQALRQVTAEYLQSKGYRVLQAEDGPHAIEVLESYEGVIHGLITDMVMPGCGGTKVADVCLFKRPNTRIIFVSGYAEGAIVQELSMRSVIYLQKPVSLNVLAKTLRQLLSEHSA